METERRGAKLASLGNTLIADWRPMAKGILNNRRSEEMLLVTAKNMTTIAEILGGHKLWKSISTGETHVPFAERCMEAPK